MGKVACFVTREGGIGPELLLFHHPYAGIQIPAGTITDGESAEAAALREAHEESGLPLESLRIVQEIGMIEEKWPGRVFTLRDTTAFSRPDAESFGWAYIRHGILVRPEREDGDFLQVIYSEGDRYPDPQYISFQITGWVRREDVTDTAHRHLFHLAAVGNTKDGEWEVVTDNHRFRLFWAPLAALPEIVPPQAAWLEQARETLQYKFA